MLLQLFRSSVCGEGICKLAPRCWRALAAPLEHPTPPSPSNLPSSDHLDKLFVETLVPLALLVAAQLVAWVRAHTRPNKEGESESQHVLGYWMSLLFLVLPGKVTHGVLGLPGDTRGSSIRPSINTGTKFEPFLPQQSSRAACVSHFGSSRSMMARAEAQPS